MPAILSELYAVHLLDRAVDGLALAPMHLFLQRRIGAIVQLAYRTRCSLDSRVRQRDSTLISQIQIGYLNSQLRRIPEICRLDHSTHTQRDRNT